MARNTVKDIHRLIHNNDHDSSDAVFGTTCIELTSIYLHGWWWVVVHG
jgi:hypothetical protein